MQTTHQIISSYIDEAVEKAASKIDAKINTRIERITDEAADKAVKKYAKETEQHMTDLKTFFSIELGKVAELVSSRPTEERVREIVREEIK